MVTSSDSQETKLNESSSSEIDYLISHIEQHPNPQLRKLSKLAQQGKPLPAKCLQKIINSLINNPEDLHGKLTPSQTVKNHAYLTASCTNIANLIDFISNLPLFTFAFASFPNPLHHILSLFADGLLLVLSNKNATIAANKAKYGHFWNSVGLGTMITLSIVKSLVAGVGSELLLNQPELERKLAETLITKQQEKLEDLKSIDSPEFKDARQQLKEKNAQLQKLEKSHPRWNSLYIELYGEYGERDRDWTGVPKEKLPLTILVKRLEAESYKSYNTAKKQLEQKLAKRSDIGNDVIFLQKEMPFVYAGNFAENGEIKSGSKAVEIATLNFFQKLINGDFAGLGFSLFFFSLSVVTSTASVLLTIAYANREDVIQSQQLDSDAEKLIKEWFENKYKLLHNFPPNDE